MDNTNVIEAIRSGSKEAIQKVYTENAKDVYEFTNSLIQDSARAKEITRITFVNLFKKINAGDTPDDLRMAAMKQAYEEAQPYMPKPEPAESVDIADEIEEITEQVNAAPDEIAAGAEEAAETVETEITAAEPEAFDEEPEQPAAKIENSADMAEAIKARLSEAAEKEAVAAESAVASEIEDDAEDVENIVLEEDVELVKDEPEQVYYDEPAEEKSVHHTQVIDISEAPEESDVIIAEAEEEYERGEYEDEYDRDFDEDEYDDDYDDYDDEKPKKRGFFTVLVIINIILILLLLWLLVGLLVNLGVLPESLDLGYTWFNETIFPIF